MHHNFVGIMSLALRISIALLAVGETQAVQEQKKEMAKITGSVDFKEKVDLAPNAVVTIELQDTSIQDAKAITLVSLTINGLKSFPIPFEIEYSPGEINPKKTYSLSVRITTDKQLDYINDTQIPVITRGSPIKDVKAMVTKVKKG